MAEDPVAKEYAPTNVKGGKSQPEPGQEAGNKDAQTKEQEKLSTKFLKLTEKFNFVNTIATMADRMLKFLGIEFTIAAVIRQSQVSTNLISNIFRLFGIIADTLLLPFLPLLGPLAKFVTTKVVPFIQEKLVPKIERISGSIGGLLNFLFGLAEAWGPFFEGIFEGIATLLEWLGSAFQWLVSWGSGMKTALFGFVTGFIVFRKLFAIFTALYQKLWGIESAQMERGFKGIQGRQDITNALLKNQLALAQKEALGAVPGLPGSGGLGRAGSILGFAGGALPILLGAAATATLAGLFLKPPDSSGANDGAGKQTIGAELTLSFINQGDGERHYQVDEVLSKNDNTNFAVSVGDA